MNENRRADSLNLVNILLFVGKWKWVLLIVAVVSAVPTYFLTKSIPPEYESYAVIFPSVSRSRDRLLENFDFGYEVHAERLVQLLDSDAMKDSVIERFDLVDYYGIDQSRPTWYDDLLTAYYERIHFNKTKYKSVVIMARDRDPVQAAAIANEIARLINVISNNIVRATGRDLLESVERDYQRIEKELAGLTDTISQRENRIISLREKRLVDNIRRHSQRVQEIRKQLDEMRQEHAIFDYSHQINILNEKLANATEKELDATGKLEVFQNASSVPDSMRLAAEAQARAAQKRKSHFAKRLKELTEINDVYTRLEMELKMEEDLLRDVNKEYQSLVNKVVPELSSRNIESLERDFSYDKERLQELQGKYEDAQSNFFNPVPVAYVVSQARPSYKKVYPSTRTNVALTVFFALILTVITLLIRERLQEIKTGA